MDRRDWVERAVERTVDRTREHLQRQTDNVERQESWNYGHRMFSVFQDLISEDMNQHGYIGGSLGHEQGENHGYVSRAYDPAQAPVLFSLRTQQDEGYALLGYERTLQPAITNPFASASDVSFAQDRIQEDVPPLSFEFHISFFESLSTGLASEDRRRRTPGEDSNQRRAETQLATRNPFASASDVYAHPFRFSRIEHVGPDRSDQAPSEDSNQRRAETQPTGAHLEVPHRNEADRPFENPWEVFIEGRSLPDGPMQSTGTQSPAPNPSEPAPPRRDGGQQE